MDDLKPETSQFVRYDEGYYYGWHRDASKVPIEAKGGDIHKRVVSSTILLNSDFKGGEFQIKETKNGNIITLDMERGDMVVFKSNLYHQINKVTDGVRNSIVTWFRKN